MNQEHKMTQEHKVSDTPTFFQHVNTQSPKRQHLINEIKELKKEAEQVLESYRQEILERTNLILAHAEENSSGEDDEEDDYSSIHSLRRDKRKMSEVVDSLYELKVPLHPYCAGCNRLPEHGGPHPGQPAHMGTNGCLNIN